MGDTKGSEVVLSPQVQWAQRKHMIILRVLVKPLEKPDFAIREDYMTFKGMAIGMSGKAQFGFKLVFYEPIQSDKCRVKFLENEIEFRLIKKQEGVWPRIQSSLEKPHWISLDFSHWEYQDEGSEGEEKDEEKERTMDPKKIEEMAKTKAQMDELQSFIKLNTERYEYLINLLNKIKIGYLLFYNGVQWSGFILVVLALLKAVKGGMDGISTAYEKTSSMIMFCHLLMLLEIIHSAIGIVKGNLISTFLQVFGRFFIVFAVLSPATEIHTHPIVCALFLAWSLIEVIRYPYYALSVINIEVKQLTWLRYTAWIPLYPLGFTCEALTIWLSLEHFDSTDDMHYLLPNNLNISFYPPYILRVVLCIVPLIAFNQITYMFAQRRNKLKKLKTG